MSEASDAVSPQNRREPGAVRDGRWKVQGWQGLAAAMLLLQAGTAHAQAPEQERLLSTEEEAVLGEITVTATRDERSVLDVPQTVDVITKKEIEERVARDIQDLVRYTPGVSVPRQTSGANPFGQLTGFQVRGVSGNRVQILVDGSRVQEITTDGSRDFVDPFNLKAVEVVRGPNSVLWGSDALGGVVNFRTRDPEDLLADAGKPWAVEVRGAYDSFDQSWRSQVTGAVEHGDIQMLASLGYLGASEPELGRARADGGIYGCPRIAILPCNVLYPSDTDAYNGLFKIVWTPTQEHKFKATGEFFDRNSTVDQVFDFSANSTAGSAFFYTNEDWQRDLDMTRTRASFEHEWTVSQPWLDSVKWSLSHSPQRRLTESRQERFYSRVARPRTQIVEQLRDYGETFTELDVVAQSSFDLAASSHTLIYGFDGDWTNTEYDGVNTTFRSDTGATTVVGNQGFNFPQVETRRADVFVQDEIKLFDERLTLTPGLRYSTYRLDPTADEDYVGLPGFEPGVVSQDKITKKLGAVFKLDETYSLYGSYGEGFKVPTSQQLFVSVQDPFSFPPVNVIPNPNLKPESVRSYEAGVRGEWNTAYFSAGVFYADYENFIRGLVTVNPADPNTVTSDNVSDVKLWGIEASAEAELWRNLVGTASLSYQRGTQRLTADAEETAFDGAVPFTAVLGLRYLLPDWNLETEVIGTFASGVTRRADPDAFKPDGYAVFDAFVHWKPGKGFELDAGVQNIFDKRYFPNTLSGYSQTVTSAVANVNPIELQTAPGRTFKLGITQRF
ncbi:MAG: TonB-dependent hemoglobin/transferrin/lactoferrin family receptor [Mesorhizobium amorphae]|nr:MAG: TonB-dependent hemoglobin/transferrin/lactoferrin family receptor [Mesorhizobium amorphae]